MAGEQPRYDVIILGASGFTGKYVVKESLKFLSRLSRSSWKPTRPSTSKPPPRKARWSFRLAGLILFRRSLGSCLTQDSGWGQQCRIGWKLVSLESDKRISGNFGTFESAVLGVANVGELVQLRRSRPKKPRPQIPGPPPSEGPTIEHQKKIGLWAVKLPSADATVVRRTLGALVENPEGLPGRNESDEHIQKRAAFWMTVKPAHFGVKIGSKSLLGILGIMTVRLFLGLLVQFSFGRWLL